MGGQVSKVTFDTELAKAKERRNYIQLDVSLGRDFTSASTDARDPKCVWARRDGSPVARVRLGSTVVVHDLISLYGASGEETSHDVMQDDKTGRLEMERHTLSLKSPVNESHPSFSGLKIYHGTRKWRLAPVHAERAGGVLRRGSFLVQEGASKGDEDVVGFIQVDDYAVSDFLLAETFTPIQISAVLYVLTRLWNGILRVPGEKGVKGGQSAPVARARGTSK